MANTSTERRRSLEFSKVKKIQSMYKFQLKNISLMKNKTTHHPKLKNDSNGPSENDLNEVPGKEF